jgi:hypothetical protein
LLEKSSVIGETHNAHHRALPRVLPFQFRHSNIEFPPQLRSTCRLSLSECASGI